MCKIICITNRKSCNGNFYQQMEKIASARPDAVIVREKDLSPEEYAVLFESVQEICRNIPVIPHNFPEISSSKTIHLPLGKLRTFPDEKKQHFSKIGTSCHSLQDADEALSLRANYLIAGHIFETACKKGLPARGLEFLKNLCQHTPLPVYAIGGISPENISDVIQAGAKGVCIMSGFMHCQDPESYLKNLRLLSKGVIKP